MFMKLVLLSLVALAWTRPQHSAAKYPAGVNPHDCPNFPFCDNAHLHNPHKWQQHDWQHQHHWDAHGHSWQPEHHWDDHGHSWQSEHHWDDHGHSWQPEHHWGASASGSGGDKYPAGVNPHSCPNYPFCDVHAGGAGVHVSPLPGWTERQYPAGVSPHTCPNFPYCH